jgi:hypothetical protein
LEDFIADVIRQMCTTERQARIVFENSEQGFHQIADNIEEMFWVIDARTRRAIFLTPAYETITGSPVNPWRRTAPRASLS